MRLPEGAPSYMTHFGRNGSPAPISSLSRPLLPRPEIRHQKLLGSGGPTAIFSGAWKGGEAGNSRGELWLGVARTAPHVSLEAAGGGGRALAAPLQLCSRLC